MARTLQIIERNKAEKIYRLINYIIDLVVCAFMMWFFFLGFYFTNILFWEQL